MNNSVLISIQPKWCELIASVKKTVEIRKTRPKLDTPFKCYIYCTKGRDTLWRGKDRCYVSDYWENEKDIGCVGKVIGEFVCNKVDRIAHCGTSNYDFNLKLVDTQLRAMHVSGKYLNQCQLSYADMTRYANGRDIYGWHISDLVIYDEPKSLEVFNASCLKIKPCETCRYSVNDDLPFAEISAGCDRTIRRPPQSWCYVEELR